jgi:hypothetical protein
MVAMAGWGFPKVNYAHRNACMSSYETLVVVFRVKLKLRLASITRFNKTHFPSGVLGFLLAIDGYIDIAQLTDLLL